MFAEFLEFLRHLKPGYMLLIQACIVVFVPYVLWRTMRLGKFFPLGVIQIFAGVLLGPSIFGALAPDLFEPLFSSNLQVDGKVIDRAAGISSLATIAVCLFGFLAGADADKEVITKSGPAIVSIGIFGMLAGWIMSSAAGWGIYYWIPEAHGPNTPVFSFAIAYGLVIAVSALPILALILRELNITRRRIGAVALGSSGLADTMMWMGLALVVALSGFGGSVVTAVLKAVGGGILSFAFIRFIAYPILNRMLDREAPEMAIMTLTALSIFVASAITAITELHPVLGAFVAGVFLPDRVRELAAHKLDQPTSLVLMPFFFLNTGLQAVFAYGDPTIWILFGVSMFLCLFTKIVGHGVAARLTGESWPFAFSIGFLLQTKGLMGLIVISVFLEKEIVTQLTFSAAVLMCMVSTGLPTVGMRWMFRIFGDALADGDRKAVKADADAPVIAEAEAPQPSAGKEPAIAVLEFDEDLGKIQVTKPVTMIGRHSEDDVHINDVRVSRHHAKLQQSDGKFELFNLTADRSQANPILINGDEKEHAVLKDGDRVSVGGATTFTFRAPSAK